MKFTSALFIFFGVVLINGCNPGKSTKPDSGTAEPTYRIAWEHAKVWDEAIRQIMNLADAMPEDSLDYRPHDSIRTFAEQLVHIGESSRLIAHMYLKEAPPKNNGKVDANSLSREELKEYVKTQLEEVGEIFRSMSDENLREEITSFSGKKMSKLEGMLNVHDHLTNHKAKANLYIRLIGGDPPAYHYY